MSFLSPLRPALYAALQRRCGRVEVVHPGEPFKPTGIADMSCPNGIRLTFASWGETYRVSCPYCGDTRSRLYIGHAWGVRSDQLKTSFYFLIKCHNDKCFDSHDSRIAFYQTLFADAYRLPVSKRDEIRQGRAEPRTVKPVLPAGITYLNQLEANHPARVYLQERRFDPDMLAKYYGVSYCWDGGGVSAAATGRLIIPIKQHNEFLGWQARYIGERADWKGVPKYHTMYGMSKSSCLYNYDNAVDYKFVVLVEGVTDMWRFGPEAVAIFGKDISPAQIELICQTPNWQTVIVLLDSTARKESDIIFWKLSSRLDRVFSLYLTTPGDPGSQDTDALRAALFRAMRKLDVELEDSQEAING